MGRMRIFVYALVSLALMGLLVVYINSHSPTLILSEKASWEHSERGTFTIEGTISNKGKEPVPGVVVVAECIEETGGFIFRERALGEYTTTRDLGSVGAREKKEFAIDIECPGTRIVVRARSGE